MTAEDGRPTGREPQIEADVPKPSMPRYVHQFASETRERGLFHSCWNCRWRARLWYAGFGLLVLAAVALIWSVTVPDGPARLAGSAVVQPGTRAWQLGLGLYLAAAACWLVVASLVVFEHPNEERSLGRSVAIGVGGVCVLVAGLVGLGGTSFFINGFDEYLVLDPPSPDGCVLVRRQGFVLGGSVNDIEVKPAGTTALHPTEVSYDFSPPDPVTEGDWSLTWHGRDGVLQIADETFLVECTTAQPG